MNGFHFYLRGKDYFVVTDHMRKTRRLAENILSLIGCVTSDANIEFLMQRMKKAVCDIKETRSGKRFYEISGENFGGYGSFVDDGQTVILYL